MAEQFNYSSVLAPYMKHLLEVKSSQGISAHRTKWILKEIDDFAALCKILRVVPAYKDNVPLRM